MERAVCNAVWALLGSAPTRTLQDFELLGEVDPREALIYLAELIKAKYVGFAPFTRLDSGQYVITFRSLTWPSDDAPYIDDEGNLVNPSAARMGTDGSRAARRTNRTRSELPTYTARMRLAAERLGDSFTRDELKTAMQVRTADDKRCFDYAWHGLVQKGYFASSLDGRTFSYARRDPRTEAIREFFRTHINQELRAGDIPNLQGDMHAGPKIRAALDMLAAEGYPVTITPKRGGKPATYRVAARAEQA